MQSTSCFDGAYEVFYQVLMLGIATIMRDGYYVSSNLESGEGRFDIQLEPKKEMLPAIIMELKAVRKEFSTEVEQNSFLKNEAGKALLQINKNGYTTDLQMHGAKTVILYGLAFHGKHVEIVNEYKNL